MRHDIAVGEHDRIAGIDFDRGWRKRKMRDYNVDGLRIRARAETGRERKSDGSNATDADHLVQPLLEPIDHMLGMAHMNLEDLVGIGHELFEFRILDRWNPLLRDRLDDDLVVGEFILRVGLIEGGA